MRERSFADMTAAFCRHHCGRALGSVFEHAPKIVSAGVDPRAGYGGDTHDQLYRAPDVLGGAMIDGGEASPVESVPADAGGSPQPL